MAQGGSGGIRQFIGLTGEEEVRRAFKSLGEVGEKAFQDISRAAAASAGNVAGFGRSLKGADIGVRSFSRTVSSAAEGLVSLRGAMAALATGAAVRGVADIFSDTAKKITELRNTAKAAAMSPGDVQAFQEVVEDTGESADGARQALTALTDRIAKARIESRGFGTDLATGINVMRGAEGAADGLVKVLRGGEGANAFGVDVNRGGQAAAKSVDALTQKIIDNAKQFTDNKRAVQSVLEDLGKLKKQDAALGTAVGVDLLGRRYALFAEAIDRLSKGGAWDAVKAELKEQGRLIDENGTSRAEQYNKAVDALGDAWEKVKFAIAIPLFPTVAAGITQIATLVENFDQLAAKYKELKDRSGLDAIEDNIVGPIRRGVTGALDALRQFGLDIPGPIGASFTILADLIKVSVDLITGNLSGALTDFGVLATDVWTAVNGLVTGFGDAVKGAIGLIGDLITWVGNLLNTIASLPSSLFGGTGTAAPAIPGAVYASGGMVRGPGGIDKVPARLTSGEYVMRTAAVDHWGPRFMHALNNLKNPLGFADGGLVGLGASLMPASGARFAEGGLAAAETGTPVHLHFPSGAQVQLRGDRAVTEALLREARRAQMLSGGRRPGAFAAA